MSLSHACLTLRISGRTGFAKECLTQDASPTSPKLRLIHEQETSFSTYNSFFQPSVFAVEDLTGETVPMVVVVRPDSPE